MNSKEGEGWKIWEQPDDYPSRGLPAFRALEAARLQGEEAYDRMLFALVQGRHENRKDYTEPADIEEMARSAGLDMERFNRDRGNRDLLKRVGEDHMQAVTKLGVFGVPTFAFENGETFFMRITAPKDTQQAVKTFEGLYQMFVEQPNINEVKRPKKPSS